VEDRPEQSAHAGDFSALVASASTRRNSTVRSRCSDDKEVALSHVCAVAKTA
jgi:hypothetical protein